MITYLQPSGESMAGIEAVVFELPARCQVSQWYDFYFMTCLPEIRLCYDLTIV